MAMDKDSLKGRIISEMQAAGATPSGPHSWVERFAEAVASAVVDEIQANAEVPVLGGSSAGIYKVN